MRLFSHLSSLPSNFSLGLQQSHPFFYKDLQPSRHFLFGLGLHRSHHCLLDLLLLYSVQYLIPFYIYGFTVVYMPISSGEMYF